MNDHEKTTNTMLAGSTLLLVAATAVPVLGWVAIPFALGTWGRAVKDTLR